MSDRLFYFQGTPTGSWQVIRQQTIAGEPLPEIQQLSITTEPLSDAVWTLRGITSNERYVNKLEKSQLISQQQGLGRLQSTSAVLIPIRKNSAWWLLTQDERREIFEESSHHIQIGLRYLPEIARRLHHCRDLSSQEPFDFLTWFEFAPEHAAMFQDLLGELRETLEWKYIDRESEILLTRNI